MPPHISPEYDFSRLSPWGLCLLGDLHFNHRYGDTNCYYPGSPLNTTFDRDDAREYGVDIYDFNSDSHYLLDDFTILIYQNSSDAQLQLENQCPQMQRIM